MVVTGSAVMPMNDAIRKADVLIEALSYIRTFRDKLTVIKVGGSAMEDAGALRDTLQDVVFMETVGMRPGEKLQEELFYEWESLVATAAPGVFLAHPVFDPKPVLGKVDELLMAANARDHEHVKSLLVEIVPEYVGEVTF